MSESFRTNRTVTRRNTLLLLMADLIFLALFSGYIAFYRTGEISFHHVDEATHVRVTQEMQRTGDLWNPKVFGKNYYNKPPFKMWLTLIPTKIFGETNFGFRFIDALTGVLSTLILYLFARSVFHSRTVALVSSAVLITAPAYVFHHGLRTATQDSMANFLNLISMIIAWRMLGILRRESSESGEQRKKVILYSLLGGLTVGLSVLTKNVVGYIPIFIIGLFILISGDLKTVIRRGKLPLAIVLGLGMLIPALYIIPHCLQSRGMYMVMVGDEVIERATIGYHNQERPYFYFKKLLHRAGPPPELLLPGLLMSLGFWVFRKERRHLFILLWGLAPLLAFSVIPSRLTWYMVPAFPGLALLCGVSFGVALEQFLRRGSLWWKGSSRSLLSPVAFGVYLLVGLAGLSMNGAFVLKAVSDKSYRLDLDTITAEILESKPLSEMRLLQLGQLRLERNERIYVDRMRRVDAYKELSSLAAEISKEDVGYVLADATAFKDIAPLRTIDSFRFIAPELTRNNWLVFISYVKGVTTLESVSQSFNVVADERLPINGWSSPKDIRGAAARLLSGQDGAFLLKTSKAFEDRPAKLRFSAAMSKPAERPGIDVEVLINSRAVGELHVGGGLFRNYEIAVPPGVFKSGNSVLTLRVKNYSDSDRFQLALSRVALFLHTGPESR